MKTFDESWISQYSTRPLHAASEFQVSGLILQSPTALRDQRHLQIADVGVGRTGSEQVAEPIEEYVGVVVVEIASRVKAERPRPLEGGRVDDGAGGVGRTIDAVGPDAGGHQRIAR